MFVITLQFIFLPKQHINNVELFYVARTNAKVLVDQSNSL